MKHLPVSLCLLTLVLFFAVALDQQGALSRLTVSVPSFFLVAPAALALVALLANSRPLSWIAWLCNLAAIPAVLFGELISLMMIGSGHTGPVHFMFLTAALVFAACPIVNVFAIRPWRSAQVAE